jgi:hypothetical protein
MTSPHRTPFSKRKRWIAAAVLWLAIVYPLGYGPACWLIWQRPHPWVRDFVGFVYLPIDLLVMRGPPWVSSPLRIYMNLWDSRGDLDDFLHAKTAAG